MHERAKGPDERRNIVLVTVDSLRADYCGWLNEDEKLTPTLDEMARTGISFENAIAPGPSTHDSMPQIFSGRHIFPSRSGIEKKEDIVAQLHKRPSLPVRMSDLGYSTAAFTPNVYSSRHFGYDRGFDTFIDFLDRTSLLGRIRSEAVSRWSDGGIAGGIRFVFNMSGVGEEAISWWDFYSELLDTVMELPEPFFLWVFLMEPHWPYHPSPQYRGDVGFAEMFKLNWKASRLADSKPTRKEAERLRKLYGSTIRDVDDFARELQEDLEGYDPAIVVHADHGEAFGERGRFGHGEYLYEENVHVPLVVGNAGATATVREPISLRKLPDLLIHLAEDRPGEIKDLTDWSVVATEEGGSACVRGRDWKIYGHRDGSVTGHRLAGIGPESNGNDVSEDAVLCSPVRRIGSHHVELREIADGFRSGFTDRL